MKEMFGITALEETRLWNKYTSNFYEQLARLDNTVQVYSFIRPLNHIFNSKSWFEVLPFDQNL